MKALNASLSSVGRRDAFVISVYECLKPATHGASHNINSCIKEKNIGPVILNTRLPHRAAGEEHGFQLMFSVFGCALQKSRDPFEERYLHRSAAATARVMLFRRRRAYTYKLPLAVSLECPNFTLQLSTSTFKQLNMKANLVYLLALTTALVHATPTTTSVSSLVSSP